MDIFKPVFKLLLILAVLIVVGFFGYREYLVVKVANLVDNDFKALFRQYTIGSKAVDCRDQFNGLGPETGSDIYQLRFIDKRNYVTEVLCGGLPSKAITIRSISLPSFVTHNAVGTGFIANNEDSSEMVGFDVFGESKVKWQNQVLTQLPFLKKGFYLIKNKYQLDKETNLNPAQALNNEVGPKTTCAGNGFTCCNPVTSLGQGQLKTNVFDCIDSCYLACKPRPVILAFNASGDFDPYKRTVTLIGNQAVSFSVVVDNQNLDIAGVEVDFGDGQNAKLSGEGPFEISHNYVCNQAQCKFIAHAKATTAEGISSYDSSVAKVTVIVQR